MDENENSNDIKISKSMSYYYKTQKDFSNIPLPNFSERHLNYFQKIKEEHKTILESDTEIELRNKYLLIIKVLTIIKIKIIVNLYIVKNLLILEILLIILIQT